MSSIGNAHRRPGRAKTRYRTRGTGGRARQSGGSSGPPKLDSTDVSVQCTLLQRTVATVLHDGSELQFRAVSFPGPTELRLLSLTGQETCPRACHDRIPAVFDDRLQAKKRVEVLVVPRQSRGVINQDGVELVLAPSSIRAETSPLPAASRNSATKNDAAHDTGATASKGAPIVQRHDIVASTHDNVGVKTSPA